MHLLKIRIAKPEAKFNEVDTSNVKRNTSFSHTKIRRLSKASRAGHDLELAAVKAVAKANNIPVTALIISILVTHFRRALTVRRDTLRICVSYAFQSVGFQIPSVSSPKVDLKFLNNIQK